VENQCNPPNKEKSKPLIVHLTNDLGSVNIQKSIEHFSIPIELTSFKDLSHLTITRQVSKDNDLLAFSFSYNHLENEIILKHSQTNLDNIIKKSFNVINKKEFTNNKYSLNENKLNKFFSNKIKKISNWNKKKDELLELSLSTTTIHSLPKKLLELSQFSSYLSAHIIIHSKGNLMATAFDFNKSYGFKKRLIEAKDFSTIYNIIKKSKNKSFNNLLLKNLNLELVGSFLAKELELSKYNIIVVISRNDFLAPHKDEIQYFNSFSKMLPKFLTHLLDSEKQNSETIYLLESLNNLPAPIRIIETNGKIYFQNKMFEKLNDSLGPYEKIKISDGLLLQIYRRADQDSNASDIFHFQRISLLGELLNTLRHELSNPLFGLKLAIDIFEKDNLQEDDKEIFKEISHSIERSQLIIDNFSNLYSNKNTFSKTPIKRLINETLTLTKSETKGLNKYIEYTEIDEVDQLEFMVNPTWFVQILFNLIINSAQALNQDASKSSLKKYFKIEIIKNHENLEIKVSDNGPGIKNITAQDLFKPFETTKKTGTGLGLAISKNLAKKMGGDLYYDSNYKEGALFVFSLSLKQNENINY
jgi:two-component system, NtrC family, sensor kinase